MTDPAPERRRATYLTVGLLVAVLIAVGLAVHHTREQTRQAESKADQLIGTLTAQGLRAPSKDQVVSLLGDDGGAVCADPNAALTRAALASQLANGAGGPGTRPVVADRDVVSGELAVLQVYCPDQVAEFTTFVENTRFADVTKR